MQEQDIRWEQRFSNFVKALTKLKQAVDYIKLHVISSEASLAAEEIEDVLDEMIKEGLIQRFEYTHELAWNVMKDYAIYQGNPTIGGSRDATREAFQLNLITNGEVWMDMISSRNKSVHTYHKETAKEVYSKILLEYYPAFLDFNTVMEGKRGGKQQHLFNKS